MAVTVRFSQYGRYYGNTYASGTSNYMTLNQMKVNAVCIYNFLHANGWTLNAIAGILGNMEAESGMNPGIWQNNDVGNTSGGYGLVQWTPATKYLNWVIPGGDPSTMENNIGRILYELENNLQWIPTERFPYSFETFSHSNDTPENLASAFLFNYERPASPNEESRRTKALYWYIYLGGHIGKMKYAETHFKWVIYANKLRKKYNLKNK